MRSARLPSRKRLERAADADGAEQEDCGSLIQAVVECIGHQMHEGDEDAEGCEQAGGVKADELRGSDGLGHRRSRGGFCRGTRVYGGAIGAGAAVPRIVDDQGGHCDADQGCEHAEDEIGVSPAEGSDQPGGEWRHDQGSDTDAADRKAGRKAAARHEPALHRANRRHIGEADTKTDADAVGGVDLDDAASPAGKGKADADEEHAEHGKPPRAKAVGKWA